MWTKFSPQSNWLKKIRRSREPLVVIPWKLVGTNSTYWNLQLDFNYHFSGTFEIDKFGIRSSAAEFGSWIASFLWLKKISVFSDEPVRSQLTYLVQDQLGYSLPPFGDPLAVFFRSHTKWSCCSPFDIGNHHSVPVIGKRLIYPILFEIVTILFVIFGWFSDFRLVS